MDLIREKLLATLLLILISTPAVTFAVVISPFELPSDIQACMSNATCAASTSSVMDYNNTSIFEYYDITNNVSGKLIRYELINSYQIQHDVVTSYNGAVWLQASDQYSLENSLHDFTLYLDNVTPIPTDMSYSGEPLKINIKLTASDLINGSGFISEYLDWDNGVVTSGNLKTDGLPQLCLAIDCGLYASFNLIYLQYISDGSTATLLPYLNTDDTRGALYSQKHYYDDGSGDPFMSYYAEQAYTVQAVPVPVSAWLFVSGLIGLAGVVRCKKREVTIRM